MEKKQVKLTKKIISWEKKWDIFMIRFAFQESTVKHFISLLLRETKQEFLEDLENARDDDSCECDNCHRTRKFIKEYIK